MENLAGRTYGKWTVLDDYIAPLVDLKERKNSNELY